MINRKRGCCCTECSREKANILGAHSICYSEQKSVYIHASYSKRFRFTVVQCTLYRRATRHVLTRDAKCADVDSGMF
jgi:hypothetical protein